MYKFLVAAVVAVLVSGSFARIAPSFINICPGLKSDCLKKTIQESIPQFTKGIKELGIISTDPLLDDNVDLELPGAFKVHLNNGTLTGLRKCVVEDVSNTSESILKKSAFSSAKHGLILNFFYSFQNDEAFLSLRCNATIKGQYTAKGNILIVTINGEGDAKIKTYNIKIEAVIKFKDVVRDGVTYYEIKDYKVKHRYGDKVTFVLTNLFKGNPQLSEAVLAFLNGNWEQIVSEFGGPILDRLVKIMFDNVKKFFYAIPKNELIA